MGSSAMARTTHPLDRASTLCASLVHQHATEDEHQPQQTPEDAQPPGWASAIANKTTRMKNVACTDTGIPATRPIGNDHFIGRRRDREVPTR